eukprot:342048-Chlamydomonas_euryale.AAC.1
MHLGGRQRDGRRVDEHARRTAAEDRRAAVAARATAAILYCLSSVRQLAVRVCGRGRRRVAL